MRRLLVLLVTMGVLGVCAPSYGYILVYKLSSKVKAVYEDANALGGIKVKGYLALSIADGTEAADDMQMVLYGYDVLGNKIYYVENFEGNADLLWTEEGAYVTLYITNHREQFYYDIWLTGTIKEKDVGFGADDLRSAPGSLKGSFASTSGLILDDSQLLFGSGSISMSLDKSRTVSANDLSATVDQVISSVVDGLIENGYAESGIP